MKNLILVSFLFLGLIGCGEKETVEPTARKMSSSNIAKVIVETDSRFAFGLRYLHPDGTEESVISKDTIVTGDYEVEFAVDRIQDFTYAIQKKDFGDKNEIKVRFIFKDYDNTKTFNQSTMCYDIYKFNQ